MIEVTVESVEDYTTRIIGATFEQMEVGPSDCMYTAFTITLNSSCMYMYIVCMYIGSSDWMYFITLTLHAV